MDVASIACRYLDRFKASHSASTMPDQWSALNAIMGCRTEQYGELQLACKACLRIPAHREHPFWFNVNTYSGRT